MNKNVVTRFAPSPTGLLHIGGARTALFNWLFARHYGGKFYLRIEDTDRERHSEDAVNKIFEGLTWMGLQWDEDPVFQHQRLSRHAAVAKELLNQGKAYYCYCSTEELTKMREESIAKKKSPKYNGMWRNKSPEEAPKDIKPVIRLKSQQEGITLLNDLVQGEISVNNSELDDFILLRSDGSPTYMLSVVVDDHDMGITHIIRGDDHLTNTFRQMQIYQACGWDLPQFAHIPLIHGPDGAKLSKRHGAVGVEAYKDMGILPEAMANYLIRLGWSHGDDEIISKEDAMKWFDLDHVGSSPSRFDMNKLLNINSYYVRNKSDTELTEIVFNELKKEEPLSEIEKQRILSGMPEIKLRAKVVSDLVDLSKIYLNNFTPPKTQESEIVQQLIDNLQNESVWSHESIEQCLRNYSEQYDIKFKSLAGILRTVLTNRNSSPGLFEIIFLLGKEETIRRLKESL